MKTFYSIFLLGFFLLNPICNYRLVAQSEKDNKPFSGSFMNYAKTSDILYIDKDSTYFLMDKSPLEKFSNYKKIYDAFDLTVFKHIHQMYGTGISPDETTKYHVIWHLNDSLLYMSGINPYIVNNKVEDIFPNNEQYKLMEKLTGVRFDTEYDRSKLPQISYSPGIMPATWFSDTIIVKQSAEYPGDIDKWRKTPCRELIFQNGKLISIRILDMY